MADVRKCFGPALRVDFGPWGVGCVKSVRAANRRISCLGQNLCTPHGQTNTFQRSVIVTYEKPDDIELTRVKVELLDNAGAPVQTVIEVDKSSFLVMELSDTQLAAQATFSASTSADSVESTPPPWDRFGYRVTLTGTNADGDTIETDPKDATGLMALWRMPDGVPRDSVRSTGGDDWSRKFTYEWIDSHRADITPINDISREHGGIFAPHDSHRFGYDMDMFHPAPLLAAGSGTQNYLELDRLARLAINGDQTAIARITAWVSGTRQWLDKMIADPDVIVIGYAKGAQDQFSIAQPLRGGWAQELLFTGAYHGPPPVNPIIETGLGQWANSNSRKLFFDDEHNNHVHVRLRSG
jgi:hypothetical protein